MFVRKFLALAIVAVVPAVLVAEEVDNPYKRAEKGQWVTYKLAVKAAGQNIDGSIKQTVTAKDDKNVTIEVVSNIGGQEQKQTQMIDLTKPFNPLINANLPMVGNTKIEKKESGKEAVEVDGKKIDCEWTNYKTEADAGGLKIEGDIKVWLAKELPVGGIAKMDMKMQVAGMEIQATMNLDKSGKD